MFPLVSNAMRFTVSSPVPPNRFDQTWLPAAEYLAITMSNPPALVRLPPPKSAVPEKYPAMTLFPLPSTATLRALSLPAPPRPLTHGTMVALLIVTDTVVELLELPAASKARLKKLWVPLGSEVVSHGLLWGALVATPSSTEPLQ